MASSSTSEACALCDDLLIIPNPDDPSYPPIPDDVILRCAHHFHWTCLMDYATSLSSPLTTCPSCHQNVLSPGTNDFIVSINNEGGVIPDFNMGEEIAREAFLENNPEARRTEIFLGLMAQGDLEEAETFLKGEDGDGEWERLSPDVSEEGNTALHVAALRYVHYPYSLSSSFDWN